MSKVKYSALEKYLLGNSEKDAMVVMGDWDTKAVVYPDCRTVLRKTALKAIENLSLVSVPAYKDWRGHAVGSFMYVFKENLYKY